MCQAFSCIIDMTGHVYWKIGLDSHEDIIKNFKLDDKTSASKLCRIEYSPENGDYIRPDKWVLRFDNTSTGAPDWWKKSHDNAVESAFMTWKKSIYSKIRMGEALNPIHPFKIKAGKITSADIALVKKWDSVWNSVGYSVEDSVWNSVGYSVWNSVGYSVWDSVGYSVWNSVGYSVWYSVEDSIRAYSSSMFKLPKKAWKYTEKIKTPGYPFQPVVALWKKGLVLAYFGEKWSLYGSKRGDGKCEKLWEEKAEGTTQRVVKG